MFIWAKCYQPSSFLLDGFYLEIVIGQLLTILILIVTG